MPEVIAYDVETTGLRRRESEIFAFSSCDWHGRTSVHRLDGSATRVAKSKLALDRLLSSDAEKTCHNMKFDYGFTNKLKSGALDIKKFHCTLLMSKILQNDHPSHALDDLCWELSGYPKDDDKAIKPYIKGGQSFQNVPESLFDKYQANDVERGMLLHRFFWPKIAANKDWVEIYENERDVIAPTLVMEDRGLMIDRKRCIVLIDKLRKDCERTLDKMAGIMGERVKPNSQCFRDYIYGDLKLPVTKKTKKTQQPSMEKDVLMEMFHTYKLPILDLAVQYTSWSRGISMLSSYLDLADVDDCLHPNIKTCEAITGREACSDPNLQNVEKHEGVILNPYPVPARTVFRPRPGFVNFHLDYAGQEARLLIHYSGDDVLVNICNDPNDGDTHSFVAELFYPGFKSLTDKLARKTKRNATKNGFFARSYGAAPPKLADTLNITIEEAFRACRRFDIALPRLSSLLGQLSTDIKKTGKIVTAFGRHLHVPRDLAYMGVNYLIQGTAAEMLKRGQVKVAEYLRAATSNEIQMLLPVHDEIIIECPRKRLPEAREILRHVAFLMTDFPGRFKVPMAVEIDVATYDWAHKEPFEL